MTVTTFIEKLKQEPKSVKFEETIAVVDTYYDFTPSSFVNGNITNQVGENSGSCKVFSFAKQLELNKEETLFCFGTYYQDVLNTPESNDHQNIRNFMKTGWEGISFEKEALLKK